MPHTERIESRTKAIIRAHLRYPGGEGEVHILDVSTRGMLCMMSEAPSCGTIVEVVVGGHALAGQVRWSGPKRFGLSFRDRISVTALLSGDADSIQLSQSLGARRRSSGLVAALGLDPRFAGTLVQFVLLICAIAVFGLMLRNYTASSLEPLSEAEAAMAGVSQVDRTAP